MADPAAQMSFWTSGDESSILDIITSISQSTPYLSREVSRVVRWSSCQSFSALWKEVNAPGRSSALSLGSRGRRICRPKRFYLSFFITLFFVVLQEEDEWKGDRVATGSTGHAA